MKQFLSTMFRILGVKCDSICDRGRYGPNCQKRCDCDANGSSCDQQFGKIIYIYQNNSIIWKYRNIYFRRCRSKYSIDNYHLR